MIEQQQKIREIISHYPPTIIKPHMLFVAWSGVITLAYEGWSPSTHALKAEINQKLPELKPENAGSKWPKTSLGAMQDGEVLSLDEYTRLHQICSEWKSRIPMEDIWQIDSLSWVLFNNRCLEEKESMIEFSLNQTLGRDCRKPLQFVEDLIGSFAPDTLEKTLPFINRPGNRESHYRSFFQENTLVFNLPAIAREASYLHGFMFAVDQALPGKYTWFSPESRHLTIRAMELENTS